MEMTADESPLWYRSERLVLNALFVGADVSTIVGILTPDDFYFENTRAVFVTALAITERGEVVEPLTVLRELERVGLKNEKTDASFIAELVTGEFASASTIEAYAEIVRQYSIKRKLFSCLKMAAAMAGKLTADPKAIISSVEKELSELTFQTAKDTKRIGEFYPTFAARLEAIGKGQGILGLTTGFKELDAQMAGFVPGELIIVAGRPAMGKSAIVMESLWQISQMKEPSLFVSLEMSGDQIYTRMACSKSEVNLLNFRSGKLHQEDYGKLILAAGQLDTAPIYLADAAVSGYDDLSIRGLIIRAVKKHGIKIVAIDYLQLMTCKSHRGNREQEVATISRGLKQLARHLNIPIIGLCQLSRKCEEHPAKLPTLSALRESGSIEADADVVIGMYRDEYYNPKTTQKKGIAEAIILKQRNGPTSTVELAFTAAFARFGNLERTDVENPENFQEPQQSSWT